MSDSPQPQVGAIGWVDLTVQNADQVTSFYQAVAGWTVQPVHMGGYDDYSMCPPETGIPVAGVCHKRGVNAQLPSVWMIYITVDDLEASMQRCLELGGKVLIEPNNMGPRSRYCVIEDPAGAVCALFAR